MSSGGLDALHVVVPCRDEAASLGAHLTALTAAVARCRTHHPGLRVDATVVLDRCRDGSADIVTRHLRTRPWLRALAVDRGNVGATRADGVRHARDASRDPARTWLACTDADSQVPSHWLLRHVAAAEEGRDAWLGTVRPAAAEDVVALWAGQHHLDVDHRHVHGANLGVRLSAYDEVGGFPPLACGEDEALVRALVAAGARIGADDRAPVLTSARRVGRAPAGFAGYLAALLP